MTNPAYCPQCGARMPLRGALEGLCAACILRQGADAVPAAEPLGEARRPAGAADPGVPAISDIQRDFPELEILELIGRGGMGLVYRARQRRIERYVALKVLAPEFAADPAFAERFLREAQALAKLQHPNVVTVHDFGERSGRYFLLMKFVEGTALRRLLDDRKLTPGEALSLIPQICAGLHYAHDEGVVHRDIKPENIIVQPDGNVVIVDFGLVKLLDRPDEDLRLTRASQVMGTPQYMAPEQFLRPLEVDHRADIYSLGVVLYEMLTAELPTGRFALPSETAHVDERLDEVVLRALENEPARRYQAAQDFGASVEHITGTDAKSAAPKDTLRRAARSWPTGRRVSFVNNNQYNGLWNLEGLIGLYADGVVIEHRPQSVPPFYEPDARILELPYDAISDFRLVKCWFGRRRLEFTVTRMALLEKFPQKRPGVIQIHFRRRDATDIDELAAHVGEAMEDPGN